VVSLYDCWSTKGYNTKTVNTETSGWQIRRISKAALDENGREVWYSVLTLIDTQVLIQGWKRKNAVKISENIFEMVRLKCLLLPLLLVKVLQVVH
jgi:hypothetical protein